MGGYPEAAQGCGFSYASRMSHLAGNRRHDLSGVSGHFHQPAMVEMTQSS
jgi:hypothetical protein